jgi:hypothetical protein
MTEPIKWSAAPDRTSWGHGMMVADVEIDKDHTLTLYCEADQTAKVDAMFAEAERLRAVISNAAHKLEQRRVWGGMDWTYPAMHPRVWRAVLNQLDAALKETK